MRATADKFEYPLKYDAPSRNRFMLTLTSPFRSPESSSSDLPPTRSGARASSRPPPGGEEITRRVSLPGNLDRAIEARREVTGESRDEAMAFLLRSALRGTEEGEPPPWAAVVSALEALGPQGTATTPGAPQVSDSELAAVAARLSDIATHHRGWLDAHHAALDETHKAAGAAVADLQGFAATAQQVHTALTRLQATVERAAAAEQAIIAKSMEEATRATQAQLEAARTQVEAARAQMTEFHEAHETHMSGLRGHIDRYRRALRLTPTVAVSFVGVACVLAVVTSIVFVPSFQKFSEDEFVQRQIAPVLREEVKKSFGVLRAENDKITQEFFDLEHDRFEKFAAHYRKQIESLKGDKAALADENQRLSRAINEQISVNIAWKKNAADLQKENDKFTKSYIQRACGSIGSNGVGSSSIALLIIPLALVFFGRSSRRRLT